MARQARCWAMNALARREHSALELKTKLLTKGCDEQLASDTVGQLLKDGLVSDARFTEGLVRYRRNRGYGPTRIAMELREKGVDEAIVEQWIDHKHPALFETVVCVREKKFGSANPDSYDERARQARFLQYRGFTFDQIDHALSHTEPDF
jgi:regulatory protein